MGENESLEKLDVVKSMKKTQIPGTEKRNPGSFQRLTISAACPMSPIAAPTLCKKS